MSTKQYARIKQQIEKLEAQAQQIRSAAIKEVVEKIKGLMAQHDISIDDIRAAMPRRRGRPPGKRAETAAASAVKAKAKGRSKKPRGRPAGKMGKDAAPARKAAVKYRSPANRKLRWSGRGRTPRWVREWVDSGKKIEELLVQ